MKDKAQTESAGKPQRAPGSFNSTPDSIRTDARFCLRSRIVMAVERRWNLQGRKPYSLLELARDAGVTGKPATVKGMISRALAELPDLIVVEHRYKATGFIFPAWVLSLATTDEVEGVAADNNTGVAVDDNRGVVANGNGVLSPTTTSKNRPSTDSSPDSYPDRESGGAKRRAHTPKKGKFTDADREIAVQIGIREAKAELVFEEWSAHPTRMNFPKWCLNEKCAQFLAVTHPNHPNNGKWRKQNGGAYGPAGVGKGDPWLVRNKPPPISERRDTEIRGLVGGFPSSERMEVGEEDESAAGRSDARLLGRG